MKKALLLMITLSVTGFVYADTPPEDTRSMQDLVQTAQQTTELGTKKTGTFLTRSIKALKGLGAGTFSVLCGALCVVGAKKGEYNCIVDPKAGLIEKVGSIGVSVFSLLLAAELGGYSLKNFQEAVKAA